jgi:hypothetical protein
MSRQDAVTAVVDLLVIAGLAVAAVLLSWLFLLPALGWCGVLVWQVRVGRRAAFIPDSDV